MLRKNKIAALHLYDLNLTPEPEVKLTETSSYYIYAYDKKEDKTSMLVTAEDNMYQVMIYYTDKINLTYRV